MKPVQRAVLTALGALHPEQGTPQAPAGQQRDRLGRFIPTEPPAFRVTLNGGYSAPPPPAPPTPEQAIAEHNAFLAELIGPRDLGA